ncbi:MAG: hypothetical protein CSA40_02225, partial [Flavobacteriales bacterium]
MHGLKKWKHFYKRQVNPVDCIFCIFTPYYADDFDVLLPVEPMKERVADDNVLMPDQEKLKTKTDFDIAEEKAVKAVQKHSMSIG